MLKRGGFKEKLRGEKVLTIVLRYPGQPRAVHLFSFVSIESSTNRPEL